MRPCKMDCFCAFLCDFAVFVVPFFPAKDGLQKAQNRGKICKKCFYAIPPLVIPPFACHRHKVAMPETSRMNQNGVGVGLQEETQTEVWGSCDCVGVAHGWARVEPTAPKK